VPSPEGHPATDETVITQIQPALAIVPRVLLVDDDEIVIERLRDLITAAGYAVTTASSGDAALAALEREFAPIVILDRNMPGMDGVELCRTIRLGRHYPGYVYIMLCTAHDSEEDILSGLNAGADDYLSKRASGTQLIARLSMTDALTGAHNRRYFMSHTRRELKRMRRFGGELSLLVFDIDHFKHINDRYGHGAGDLVLVEFVRRVQSALPRDYDWCARIGGEEFAVVLPQTDVPGGAAVAEKIRLAVAASSVGTPAGLVEMTVSVGVSGVSAFPDRGAVTLEQLLRRADDCLYSSKHQGRNRVTVDEPGTREAKKALKTLLYVDDDADIREIVEMSLGLDGDLRVLSSDGGERALVKMRVEKPDLVVLDVMMPSIDGPTMLKRMRADPELRHIPVIFMTAKSDPAETARLRESAIGLIAKPFDPMALGGQVRALWSAK
jgi:two-component system cell cycle response regulator